MTLLRLSSDSPGARAAWARTSARTVLALALVAVAGVALGLVPLFFAPQAFATPILGAAAWLVAGLAGGGTRAPHLRGLGVAGFAFLGVWPAVWALEVIPPAAGIALIGAFGVGWAALAPAAIPPQRTV